MANRSSKSWRYRLLLALSKAVTNGFTLIELLVAIIISGLVVSGLLYLVVEMLQLDRREFVLNQTQQDMQRSLEYMTSDVQEAVYVYARPTAITDSLPTLTANGEIPVLAFWRPDPLSNDDLTAIDACTTDECEVLKVRQYTYSLVIYFLRENNAGSLWEGESRIIRYELPKYSSFGNPPVESLGYIDPSIDRDTDDISYANWQPDPGDGGALEGNSAVLTDYVDTPTATIPNSPDNNCTTLGPGYVRTPSVPATGPSVTSLVSCVLETVGVDNNENQDVYLFLRGNALSNRPGLINGLNEGSDNPALEARIQVRGVLNKRANDN